MTEREQLKAELFQAEEDIKVARARCEQLCDTIRNWLNPLLSAPEDMRVAEADGLMDELVVRQAELLRAQSRAEALKTALYG